jgi:hypothetical protein
MPACRVPRTAGGKAPPETNAATRTPPSQGLRETHGASATALRCQQRGLAGSRHRHSSALEQAAGRTCTCRHARAYWLRLRSPIWPAHRCCRAERPDTAARQTLTDLQLCRGRAGGGLRVSAGEPTHSELKTISVLFHMALATNWAAATEFGETESLGRTVGLRGRHSPCLEGESIGAQS